MTIKVHLLKCIVIEMPVCYCSFISPLINTRKDLFMFEKEVPCGILSTDFLTLLAKYTHIELKFAFCFFTTVRTILNAMPYIISTRTRIFCKANSHIDIHKNCLLQKMVHTV